MTFRPELYAFGGAKPYDELLKEYRKPEDLMGEGGIFKQLTKALVERCLSNELSKFWLSVLTELQNRGVKDIFNSPSGMALLSR